MTFGTAPGGAAAPPFGEGLPIEAVEIIALDIVPNVVRKASFGDYLYSPKGGWIGRPVLVGIHAGGLTGWGEIRPINPFVGETAASMFASLRDFYAPRLIGRDAMQIQRNLLLCEKALPDNPAALGTLDMAMHDLVARALGVPVHALLGGACRDRMPLEWSVGLNDEKTMIAEAVNVVEKYGVPFLCIKIGPLDRFDTDRRVAKAIQKEIGSRIELGIDANTAYDAPHAIRIANELTDDGLHYFEQPVPKLDLAAMRHIRDNISVPLIADESTGSLRDAFNIARAEAADVLAVKFYKCGGLRRCKDITMVAQAAGLQANCAGTANGSYIEAIAGAHLSVSVPNHAFGAEFLLGLPSVNEDPIVANRPIDIVDGHCNLPPGPGFGFELDMDAVASYTLERTVVGPAA